MSDFLARLADRASLHAQTALWLVGLSIHNPLRNECTPDFSCCVPRLKNDMGQRADYVWRRMQRDRRNARRA